MNLEDPFQGSFGDGRIRNQVFHGLLSAAHVAVKIEGLVTPSANRVALPFLTTGAHLAHVPVGGVRPREALDIRHALGFFKGMRNGFLVNPQAFAVSHFSHSDVPYTPERLHVPRVFFGRTVLGGQLYALVHTQPFPKLTFRGALQLREQPLRYFCGGGVVARHTIRPLS